MLTDEFGKRLKHWRNKRGLTLKDLRSKCGVAVESISKYEHGRIFPTLKTVEILLDALNVSISDFYSEEINHG